MKIKKLLGGLLVAVAVVGGAGNAAFARQGADDPAGHIRHGDGAATPAGHVSHGHGAAPTASAAPVHHGAATPAPSTSSAMEGAAAPPESPKPWRHHR